MMKPRLRSPALFCILLLPAFFWGVAELVPTEAAERPDFILALGDSMTAEQAGYSPLLARHFSPSEISDQGIGGQFLIQMAARIGAVPTIINFQEPADSGDKTERIVTVLPDLLRATRVVSIRLSVQGIECVLVFDPTKKGSYSLRATDGKTSLNSLQGSQTAIVESGFAYGSDPSREPQLSSLLKGTLVLRGGINDITWDKNYNLDNALSLIRRIIVYHNQFSDRFLVLGATNGSGDLPIRLGGSVKGDNESFTRLNNISSLNNNLKRIWPRNYLDPIANDISKGGGVNYTVNGKEFTVLTSDAHVPMFKGRHENVLGRSITADLVANAIIARGYKR